MRVLIVDDDYGTRETFSLAMQSLRKWNVTTASRGDEGLLRANTQRYDVILVDVRLPDMTGLDLLPGVRQSLSADSAVFVITGFGTSATANEAVRAGAVYFEKPLDIDLLLDAMDTLPQRPQDRLDLVLSTVAADAGLDTTRLAQVAKLSESRLRHLFKSRYGISLGRFLRNAKLDRAAELLHTSTRPIGQIAVHVGIPDARTFHRAFCRRAGLSPTAYRERHRVNRRQPELPIARPPLDF